MNVGSIEKHEETIQERGQKKKKVGRPVKPLPEIKPLVDVLATTIIHFFPEFLGWLNQLPDPRDQDMITYPRRVLIMGAILIFVLRLESRRQWTIDSLFGGVHGKC